MDGKRTYRWGTSSSGPAAARLPSSTSKIIVVIFVQWYLVAMCSIGGKVHNFFPSSYRKLQLPGTPRAPSEVVLAFAERMGLARPPIF